MTNVALVKSKNQSMASPKIRNLLAHNAIDLGDAGKDRRYGFGLVQAGQDISVRMNKSCTKIVYGVRCIQRGCPNPKPPEDMVRHA